MTDDTTTIQQTPADSATSAAIDAHISGNAEKAAPLFNRASVEHRRAAAATETGGDDWRDGTEVAPLAPMPDAPRLHPDEVSYATEKLLSLGGAHAELARNWGADLGENLAYAQAALLEVAANRPDLIAKVDASGLGDDPAVLEFLSRQGRLTAGLMNDHTISRRSEPMTTSRSAPSTPRASGLYGTTPSPK